MRGCYTALAAASMLRLDTAVLAERASAVDYIRRCQVGSGSHFGNLVQSGL